MGEARRLRAVRAIVRPDRRDEYLRRWRQYAESAEAVGAGVTLYEDQVLPGRFLELSEHVAAAGMEGELRRTLRSAELHRCCVRREGDEIIYRPVAIDD